MYIYVFSYFSVLPILGSEKITLVAAFERVELVPEHLNSNLWNLTKDLTHDNPESNKAETDFFPVHVNSDRLVQVRLQENNLTSENS